MHKLNSGLNLRILPTKLPQKRPAARLAAFDEDDGSDLPAATARGKTIEIANVNHQLRQLDPNSNRNITELKRKAQEEDSTIFEYDAVYDQMKQAEKQQLAMLQGKAEERKPRYMEGLLKAAEQRKRDRLLAEEKLVQREREAEGSLYAEKESFITNAYKKQLAELRRYEQEQDRLENKDKNKGTIDFYRRLLDNQTESASAKLEASLKAGLTEGKGGNDGRGFENASLADVQLKQALSQGKQVTLNEDQQVIDKRELLSAGLNVVHKPGGNSSEMVRQDQGALAKGYRRGEAQEWLKNKLRREKQIQRERVTQEIEKQILEQQMKKKEEDDQRLAELVEKTKRNASDDAVAKARERYMQRKKPVLESSDSE